MDLPPGKQIENLKIGDPKRKLFFQPSIFRCELLVSGRVISRSQIMPSHRIYPNYPCIDLRMAELLVNKHSQLRNHTAHDGENPSRAVACIRLCLDGKDMKLFFHSSWFSGK